jgi:hypothetical protein
MMTMMMMMMMMMMIARIQSSSFSPVALRRSICCKRGGKERRL